MQAVNMAEAVNIVHAVNMAYAVSMYLNKYCLNKGTPALGC